MFHHIRYKTNNSFYMSYEFNEWQSLNYFELPLGIAKPFPEDINSYL